MRAALDRDLPLLHRLEQRRLRLRGRPVDLVGEQQVREDRPGPELEVAAALVVDDSPVMSAGIRSGVNWMRAKLEPQRRANERAIRVLARPGKSSIRT